MSICPWFFCSFVWFVQFRFCLFVMNPPSITNVYVLLWLYMHVIGSINSIKLETTYQLIVASRWIALWNLFANSNTLYINYQSTPFFSSFQLFWIWLQIERNKPVLKSIWFYCMQKRFKSFISPWLWMLEWKCVGVCSCVCVQFMQGEL